MSYASKEEKRAYIAIIAVVVAMGVLGVVIITVATLTMQIQEAEAGCPLNTAALNASKGRCFRG